MLWRLSCVPGRSVKEWQGELAWQLDEDHVKKLAALLEEFQVWDFEYEVNGFPATDLPSCVITVIDENGAVKEIDHYLGDSLNEMERPMTLEEFEEEMDRIIGTKTYI
ncbi:DUF6438 domain-containing protein [Halobacillus andaensis]|uniref:DUF6438 domain-containing protein n=1 Tax=Halobacillus andaensis TaxID=1176239 RepID=UPI00403A7611